MKKPREAFASIDSRSSLVHWAISGATTSDYGLLKNVIGACTITDGLCLQMRLLSS
jgi:hypothetical protein